MEIGRRQIWRIRRVVQGLLRRSLLINANISAQQRRGAAMKTKSSTKASSIVSIVDGRVKRRVVATLQEIVYKENCM
ncbi:hypothetical protein KIN20_008628 [Parelaphostrongylus tenuis]|uniref:Uncharacterized protein n=1 Tax=Parelaphostrongylus tenuis TaxID=148309 RepID=A0AAD5QMT0_PARTN|nr:hypothetical protein KIN20_008628 [Parelaphostrongylus tenuis]